MQFLRELPGIEGQGFILTREGMVQHWVHGDRNGMMFATTHKAARKLAKTMQNELGRRVAVAAVGSVKGETLDGQVRSAMTVPGATGVWVTIDGRKLNFIELAAA